MSEYQVSSIDQIDEISDGRCPWRPVRHHFGITSFGISTWTGKQAGDRLINEHDEEGEDEEVYLVISGRARFELGGETVDAPTGTFVFARPGLTRTAFAEEPGTTLVAVGGRPGEVYRPEGYELWAPIAPLYNDGRYEEAAERIVPLADQHPEYTGVAYNAACIASLAGRPDDAIRFLRRAVEGDQKYREYASEDSDLDAIRDRPEFKELIG
jgi:quercetin dioxygenase-like cupin family protein